MRFLIVDGDYPETLNLLYAKNPQLRKMQYNEQLRFRNNCLLGLCDFYSSNLRLLGEEAFDSWVNNEMLQRSWAKSIDFHASRSVRRDFRLRRGLLPWVSRVQDRTWMYEILAAQIRQYKPDVLVNMMTGFVSPEFLRELSPRPRLVIGWGNPGVKEYNLDSAVLRQVYDLIIAPSEGMVDYFRSQGLRSELLRHAFEPRILSKISPTQEKTIPVSFIGLLRGGYSERRRWLEAVCSASNGTVSVWASSLEGVPADSPVRKRHQGDAWGGDFYRILAKSKITLNHHHHIAGLFADNVRMYQATGLGTLLLTDWKENLHKIFTIGKEVVTYHSPEECIALMRYYLEHESERDSIARAGQQRTLREHTYHNRALELIDIVRTHI